ncbi:uncharacterized protein DMAD_10722 [Drosophila madeirensis]|uniref:Uncharacterized protein n=1 Tax=Drosophila madeirensis TaxID=30013 RepID=A0AAU9FAJ2_DROMD
MMTTTTSTTQRCSSAHEVLDATAMPAATSTPWTWTAAVGWAGAYEYKSRWLNPSEHHRTANRVAEHTRVHEHPEPRVQSVEAQTQNLTFPKEHSRPQPVKLHK